jgi:hypothetical protein
VCLLELVNAGLVVFVPDEAEVVVTGIILAVLDESLLELITVGAVEVARVEEDAGKVVDGRTVCVIDVVVVISVKGAALGVVAVVDAAVDIFVVDVEILLVVSSAVVGVVLGTFEVSEPVTALVVVEASMVAVAVVTIVDGAMDGDVLVLVDAVAVDVSTSVLCIDVLT